MIFAAVVGLCREVFLVNRLLLVDVSGMTFLTETDLKGRLLQEDMS